MEDDKKLCPLKFIVKSDPYGGFCNKYRCAWYNARTKNARFLTFQNILIGIRLLELKLVDKMLFLFIAI